MFAYSRYRRCQLRILFINLEIKRCLKIFSYSGIVTTFGKAFLAAQISLYKQSSIFTLLRKTHTDLTFVIKRFCCRSTQLSCYFLEISSYLHILLSLQESQMTSVIFSELPMFVILERVSEFYVFVQEGIKSLLLLNE